MEPTTLTEISENEKVVDKTPQADLRLGVWCMVLSCVAFAIMGMIVNAAQWREEGVSPFVASFIRISVNLVLIVAGAFFVGEQRELVGDARWSLWARGFFGSISLMSGFAAIGAIGVGEASFLNASSGIFTVAFAPIFLRQKNSKTVWVAVIGAMLGLFLLFEPRLDDLHPYGRVLGLISGLSASLAYMMIAHAGRSNPPRTVVFYFCIVAVILHGVVFAIMPNIWPKETATYLLLLIAGVIGSIAQSLLTRAYQNAPAALNSAISYLQPVLNLLLGIVVFNRIPDSKAWIGAFIVVIFGVMLPLVRLERARRANLR